VPVGAESEDNVSVDNKVQTGIEGLDNILLGGIPRSNITLVRGATGTGKTVLGLEFIYRGITKYDEPGIIVVFEASPDKLIRDAATFGWDFQELQEQKKLQIVFTSPQVLDQEMRSPDSLLVETAAEMGAQRIFIDGIGLLHPFSNGGSSSVPATGSSSYREVMQQLIEGLNRENLTALLSLETGTFRESLESQEAAGFLCDTVIQLNRFLVNRRSQRTLEIVKSRGHEYVDGEHTLRIHNGIGMEIFRRVQAPLRSNLDQPSSMAKRSVIGVEALDTLIGGGIFDGSTTMVVGVSGVGKTVLGTQLLLEGAKKQNKRGLLISLDEHPAQIVRNSNTIGLDMKEQIDAGTIHILFESPQELDVDIHFAKIVRTIEKYDIQRMVIDGMTSYSTALGEKGVYRDFFHSLVAYSKHRLMTTFFNYENPEFLGISSYMPDFPVSSIVDNLILLSLVELDNSLHRCLTVVKARGCKHSFESREYEITEGGLKLMPDDERRFAVQSFSHYSSVLSRAPTRLASHQPTANVAEGSK
jgi:circadian clock protein KaiC